MRHRRMLAPITSNKHFVQQSNTLLGTGVVTNIVLVDAIPRGSAVAKTADCEEGSVVKAIHIEFWILGTDNNDTSQFDLLIYKNPAGNSTMEFADFLNLQAYANKKNILYTTQGVLAKDGSQSIPVIRNWLTIPKGKQRMGLGDQMVAGVLITGGEGRICGVAIYKEYL